MNTTALATVHEQAAPMMAVPTVYTREQIEVIKESVCKDATDAELKHFIQVAQYTQLSPFTSPPEIYAIKRWNPALKKEVMGIQTGIDGLLLVAERSGKYEGMAGPMWCDKQGAWVEVWTDKSLPMAAKVGIYKRGFREPLWAVVRFDSFAQKTKEGELTKQWRTMPDHMIAKCAMAQALRRAFPGKLRNLHTDVESDYLPDEDQHTAPRPVTVHVQQEPPRQLASTQPAEAGPAITDETLEALDTAKKRIRLAGGPVDAIPNVFNKRFIGAGNLGISNETDLSEAQAQQWLTYLEGQAEKFEERAKAAHAAEAGQEDVLDAEVTSEPIPPPPSAPRFELPTPISAQSRLIVEELASALINTGEHTLESLAADAGALLGWGQPVDSWGQLSEAEGLRVRECFAQTVREPSTESEEPGKPAPSGKGKKVGK